MTMKAPKIIKKAEAGFTLIELMIVVASSVSWPPSPSGVPELRDQVKNLNCADC